MKANQYIYPSKAFKNLSQKRFLGSFIEKKTISIKDLKEFVAQIPNPAIIIRGKSTAEKCLSLFLNKAILFGPKNFILDYKEYWLETFNYFINRNLPLQMTILGFPYKIPLPLKTNRTLPDLGEVMALKRLNFICEQIGKIYKPGATILVVTEGGFGQFNNIPKTEINAYKLAIKTIVKMFGWQKSIRFIGLEEMEKITPSFTVRLQKRIQNMQTLQKQKNKVFAKQYKNTLPIIKKIANAKDLQLSDNQLMDVYNEKLISTVLSTQEKQARTVIDQRAEQYLYYYFAYLQMRDELRFLGKIVPNAIALSVAPKPKRLGILPIDTNNDILPYHGVPVYYSKKSIVKIEYLIDIKRKKRKYKCVYIAGDKDKTPFIYIVK